MATAKKATRLALSCPFCGASDDNTLNLDLMTLEDVCCGGCDETYTIEAAVAKATATLAAWQGVLKMVEFGRQIAAE
jgi:hypothetical protein